MVTRITKLHLISKIFFLLLTGLLLVALIPPNLPGLEAQDDGGKVVILANSVDLGLARDLVENLSGYGFEVIVVHPSGFKTQRMERRIIILGGPDAYEGIGGIVRSLLNSSMISKVREPGASYLLKLEDVWREGQVVLISMGSDRVMTRKAHRDGIQEVLSTLAPPLILSGERTLEGRTIASTIEVRPGSRITLTGDAMLISLGPVTIEGELSGDCVGLALISFSNIIVKGALDGTCSSPPWGSGPQPEDTENQSIPGILIWGAGNVTIEGNITTSGEILISNGPNPGEVSNQLESEQNISKEAIWNPPSRNNMPRWLRWVPPMPVKKPAQGGFNNFIRMKKASLIQKPLPGCVWQRLTRTKRSWVLSAWGNIYMERSLFQSRDGRDGCNKTAMGSARAGNGEHGVSLVIAVWGFQLGIERSGSLILNSTTIKTGSGGRGGNAVATLGDDGNAEAEGGNGGSGGGVRIETEGRLFLTRNNMIVLGNSGNGGDAEARGADGADGCPGENGGDARAKAGDGGGGLCRLTVGGVEGNLLIIGGADGGDGGNAVAIPGNGGDGNASSCNGGRGGNAEAIAGNGGNIFFKAPQSLGISPTSGFSGGNGGNSTVSGGNGGNGGNGCNFEQEIFARGGDGGKGGNITAKSGSGGSGSLGDGSPGRVNVTSAANGGNGGNGNPPGSRGSPGTSNITDPSGQTSINNSFAPGSGGGNCEELGMTTADEIMWWILGGISPGKAETEKGQMTFFTRSLTFSPSITEPRILGG